jgi:hypothetical protein
VKAVKRTAAMSSLLTWLLVEPFPEPDAGPASILVDELDASRFKGSFYNVKRGSTRLMCPGFKLAHGYDADGSLFCQVLLTPIEKAPRGPALFRRDHLPSMVEMADSINSVENRLTPSIYRL